MLGSCVPALCQFAGGADDFFLECVGKPSHAVPGPVLRELSNGTEDRRDPGPPKGIEKGDLGPRAGPFRSLPPARGRYDAGGVRHSVGGKVAIYTNSAEVLQSGHGLNGRRGQ